MYSVLVVQVGKRNKGKSYIYFAIDKLSIT